MNKKETAYMEMLNNNKEGILRLCSLYATDKEEQKDLFQEVFLQLWKSFSDFRGDAKISTWAYRICLNTCLKNFYARERKYRQREIFKEISWADAGSEQPDERLDYLRQCMKTLSEADQMVMALFLEDLPYCEIAEAIGITENHVAVKMKRIKDKLFSCITRKI